MSNSVLILIESNTVVWCPHRRRWELITVNGDRLSSGFLRELASDLERMAAPYAEPITLQSVNNPFA